MTKYPYESKMWLHWHGRVGHPTIHKDSKTGRTYTMVRAKGGGVKRLYNYQKYLRPTRAKHYRDGKRKKMLKYKKE